MKMTGVRGVFVEGHRVQGHNYDLFSGRMFFGVEAAKPKLVGMGFWERGAPAMALGAL